MPNLPYWRLSGFYFFFFAILGALTPYWGPYLRSLGFSAAEIGELIAIINATKIVAPNIWGWIADHSGMRLLLVRVAALAALLSFAGVFVGSGYAWMALVMTVFSFFWNAALPQFEANTMNHLGRDEHHYSRIRLWGSVGFIFSVLALGHAIDRYGIATLPYGILLLFVGMLLSSLLTPEQRGEEEHDAQPAFLEVLKRPEVMGFFGACFMLQASHGPYYAFFSIYLQDYDYGGGVIGALWAWAVIAEIGVFLIMHRLLPVYGPRLLMTGALLVAVVRWALIARYAELLPVLIVAQTLHAATYGVYHAVGIAVVNRYFRGRNQGRGQAFYTSATFGAGVASGSLLSGYLWDPLGGSATFYLAAGLAAVAAAAAFRNLPRSL